MTPDDARHVLAIDLGTGGPKVALVASDGTVVGHEVETNGLLLTEDGGVIAMLSVRSMPVRAVASSRSKIVRFSV